MFSATMIWFATLVVWPSPLPPTSVMFLPIFSNSGFTRSNAASGPPTMMVRLAALRPPRRRTPVHPGSRSPAR